jgi:predicted nucleic acid-binding protein
MVLPEPDRDRVRALWQIWLADEIRIFAPPLFLCEGASAIRGQVYRGLLTPEEGDAAFANLQAQGIVIAFPPEILQRAWNLAKILNQPKVYDCFYLALAELNDCEFWTADERLYNSVNQKLPWVKWIGNA